MVILQAVITCPLCGQQALEAMPVDACQHFYWCAGCGEVLRPRDHRDHVAVFWPYDREMIRLRLARLPLV